MRLQLRAPDRDRRVRSARRSTLARRPPLGGQLATAALVAICAPALAHADGVLAARGVYYKERATRVMQPMLDAMLDAGTHGIVTAHFLVDAITSASASSGADNAKPFTENRIEGGVGYTHDLGRVRVGGDAKYSTESDYTSFYAGARAELDLAQKNTTLGLGGGISKDNVSAASAQGPSVPMLECKPGQSATDCDLNAYAVFASASQILSRDLVVGLTYDGAALRGYQSNPYRTAIANDGIAAERHPTSRNRNAIAASFRYYVDATNTTVIGAYRYYRDNWGIRAHTPELRLVQQVGHDIDASFGYRYHWQSKAFFYEERYATTDPAMQAYLSDDVKLSKFTSHTLEGKLGVLGEAFGLGGRWAGARFEGILEYAVQHNRFGNAIIAHLAVTVPFGS